MLADAERGRLTYPVPATDRAMATFPAPPGFAISEKRGRNERRGRVFDDVKASRVNDLLGNG